MNVSHVIAVYQAETERLFRRATAISGLVLSAVFGLLGPIIVFAINTFVVGPSRTWVETELGGQVDPAAAADMGPAFWTWDWAIYISYYGRNFMFVPILIFLLGGLSMASEFAARTTREDCLRPMPRYGLLLTKWAALVTWIIAASLITATLSGLGGLILAGGFELDSDAIVGVDGATAWGAVTAYWGYVWNPVSGAVKAILTTFLTDLGFATLALSIAVFTRSVAATVASLVMVFVLQLGLSFGFMLATNQVTEQIVGQQTPWLEEATRTMLFDWARAIAEWQPPFIIGTCEFAPPTWEGFVTLGLITVLAIVGGVARFESMDVP